MIEGGLIAREIDADNVVLPVVTMNHMEEDLGTQAPMLCAERVHGQALTRSVMGYSGSFGAGVEGVVQDVLCGFAW
jgi:hypothetical protein